jgi:hypothetical protein
MACHLPLPLRRLYCLFSFSFFLIPLSICFSFDFSFHGKGALIFSPPSFLAPASFFCFFLARFLSLLVGHRQLRKSDQESTHKANQSSSFSLLPLLATSGLKLAMCQ